MAIALPLAAAGVLWLAVDGAPSVQESRTVSAADVARTLALLRAQDPRAGRPGPMRVVTLGERDLELLLNHGAHRLLDARVSVRLGRGQARLAASRALPAGRWLNVELHLTESPGGRPVVHGLRVGALAVPAPLATAALPWLLRRHEHGAEVTAALALVQRVSLRRGAVSLVYAWDAATPQRMLATLVPADEQARLRSYRARLAAVVAGSPGGPAAPMVHPLHAGPIALSALVAPLFELARERSAAGAEAEAENRAALLTLTLYASGRPLEPIVPAAAGWPQPLPRRVTLAGREDFALHFLISAAIAVDGTSPLSRAVGVYKEVADARAGSGFSFNDIAADRAGTRFGELARSRPLELQQRLAPGVADEDLMPPWSDLPEYLSEAEFRRRFGDVGAPAYERLLAEIDRRVAALALLN